MMNNQGNKEKKEQMKKLNIAVFAVLCVVFIVVVGAIVFKSYGDELIVKYSSSSALRKSADSPKSVINIKEKQYLLWIHEIKENKEQYLERKIKIEGMYAVNTIEDETHHHVYRIGPGCCSHHGAMSGFEFISDNGEYPKENEWIEVIGTLKEVEYKGEKVLTLQNSQVTVKQERGLEAVKH
ncbi:MAG: hypothetical protein GX848_02925 [Clostridiales bacterium]|jgi:uncharacterized membrane protein YcgQ (UPF0703/DUF1980 family)|nr:hypothetical protein [Clostridiales bacterium]